MYIKVGEYSLQNYGNLFYFNIPQEYATFPLVSLTVFWRWQLHSPRHVSFKGQSIDQSMDIPWELGRNAEFMYLLLWTELCPSNVFVEV